MSTVVSTQRTRVLQSLANRILAIPSDSVLRVAIDGVDGAGKTTFGDELGRVLESSGRNIIRASVDGFHNPREQRYRLGKDSSEGFFLDSYDYSGLRAALLEPLSPGGSRRYRTAVFDHTTNSPVSVPEKEATLGSILILDGIFLHRQELRDCFDFSIFLDVPFSVSIPRGAQRGPGFGSPDPEAASNRRYIEGQKIYLSQCEPKKHATVAVENSDLMSPRLISRRNWMRFSLDLCKDPGSRLDATFATLEHVEALAHLMDVSYTGTIDHEGESLAQCSEEMKGTIEGKYGPFIGAASFVAFDKGTAASASLITLWKGHPLLAFSMTDPGYQGRGLAGFLIQKSLFALKNEGYRELYLVVTEGNIPAEKLYRKLGFEFLGLAIPGRGVPDDSLTLERVDLSAERLVQQILEAAPSYSLNTEGVSSIEGDGRATLTALPPNCKQDQKHVVILRQSGTPIGVADVINGYPDKDTAFLGLMLLREDQQRHGLGKMFYQKIEAMIAKDFGCKKVRLAVVDSNPVTQFWEKMGFKMTGDVRPHEGKKLQSLKRVMEKNL